MPDYDIWGKVLFLRFKQIKYIEKGQIDSFISLHDHRLIHNKNKPVLICKLDESYYQNKT